MPELPSVQYFRDKALRLREEAAQAVSPEHRNRLEKFARIYARLAASVEKEIGPRWPAREPMGPSTVVNSRDFP